jgi:NAD(P)-dependent dehydrogenase (short-subunit alcohol dehydrogenase family)
MSLANRVAVITGATGNLGRATARAFAEQGARLALIGTNAERLQSLAIELKLSSDRVLTHVVDLREPAGTRVAAQTIVEKFGRVDIVLHLVGGWSGGKTIAQVEASEFEAMLQQHLWTTVHLTQAFLPHLVANRWGRIIAISSPVATRPVEKSAPYAIAKAAQETLMLTLAQEVRGTGVTANILQVRAIDSKREREPGKIAWTTPEEIVAAMLYLCSDEAEIVNGARIPLYGV